MAKVEINTLGNVQNENSFLNQLNENFENIATAVENTLSRDGDTPNEMLSDLDMNDFRIVNLPAPVSPTEPARHGQLQQYVDEAEAAQLAAENAQAAAENAQTAAELAETNAETAETGAEAAQLAAENAQAAAEQAQSEVEAIQDEFITSTVVDFIVVMTEVAYQALPVKDATTLYFTYEE